MHNAQQVQAGTVSVNGTKLFYEKLGEGHPLVLIHGGYMDRSMWDDQFHVFARHYQVIRYDVRGFGKSPLPHIPYSDRQDLFELLTFRSILTRKRRIASVGTRARLSFCLPSCFASATQRGRSTKGDGGEWMSSEALE